MAEKLAQFRSIKHYAALIKSIETLEDLTATQCSDGNWNYDSYMHGMANGMIFALSLFNGEEPEFLDAPDEWKFNNELKEVAECQK